MIKTMMMMMRGEEVREEEGGRKVEVSKEKQEPHT